MSAARIKGHFSALTSFLRDIQGVAGRVSHLRQLLLDGSIGGDRDALRRFEAIDCAGRELAVIVSGLSDPATAADRLGQLGMAGILAQLRRPLLTISHQGEAIQAIPNAAHSIEVVADLLGEVHTFLGILDAVTAAAATTPAAAAAPSGLPAPEAADRSRPAAVLVVDDNPINRRLLVQQLECLGCRTEQAGDGREAMASIDAGLPDVVLLDVVMPGMSGIEVLGEIKASEELHHLPVVMVSAVDEMETVARCIQMGAADYLTKPFPPALLHARIQSCVAGKRAHDRAEDYRRKLEAYGHSLEQRVGEQVRQTTEAQLATILALAKLAEFRDTETGGHLERVQDYCRALSRALARQKLYRPVVDAAFIDTIGAASALHDIGKVGIPDQILRKPGRLSEEEFAVIKTHTVLGCRTLWAVYLSHPSNDFIHMAIEMAESHHEQWDGNGYPHGQAGEAIPLSARILAVADVYDALRSSRCYRSGMSHEQACQVILAKRGSHFAPDVVDAFAEIEEELAAIQSARCGGPG